MSSRFGREYICNFPVIPFLFLLLACLACIVCGYFEMILYRRYVSSDRWNVTEQIAAATLWEPMDLNRRRAILIVCFHYICVLSILLLTILQLTECRITWYAERWRQREEDAVPHKPPCEKREGWLQPKYQTRTFAEAIQSSQEPKGLVKLGKS